MRYISLFSGVEAATLAWETLGWEPVAFCEKEEFPSAVLAERFPDVPNLGDITKVDWSEYRGAADVAIGGFPCQSYSIAGLRKGLADPRGELMLEFLRACREIGPEWVVGENVPGLLSSHGGRDFQTLLDAVAILWPDGGAAWRVLDAQFARVPVRDGDGRVAGWFGPVAQRRRRLFLVVNTRDWRRAGAVLFEPESLCGDNPSSKQKREELARAAGRGSGARGSAGGSGGDTNMGLSDDCSPTITVRQPVDVLHEAAMTQYGSEVAGTLTAMADSSPCSDRGQNIVCMASGQANAEVTTDGTSPTVTCLHEQPIVCMADDNANAAIDVDVCGTLKIGGGIQ